ncbi:carboxylesterase [Thecamonas trahens ATCC 50062]|uniref:Carboxylic ester hydrolase n=1 Tax=Thecamonas trahens ATCC 50062 TaxID=461836 RepID=A0A0L0DJE4_THETB|nr:carboxylesterase [Thecamonas trahens ATCC 50062]KNC52529.1 carboxylesterase [Thecamonas trahens ATCC 50062]|eukprot:XP_013755322.1 carboxylesterase [Thecamonas trahens ATCC 50062]
MCLVASLIVLTLVIFATDAADSATGGAPRRFPMTAPAWERDHAVTHVVPTTTGKLTGATYVHKETGTRSVVFLGVPFAQPPVGSLRWRPPVQLPADAAEHDIDATAFAPSCVQLPSTAVPAHVQSEDCLYINLYLPEAALLAADHSAAQRPVLEYIYGGSFVSGSSANQDINGLNLTLTDAVVVTMNYRLGPFGFLATRASMAQEVTTGNYGLLDQAAAMEWVAANVAAFGGDPAGITLFGESAGAISVCFHLVWHKHRESSLFARAIMQSPDSPAQLACFRELSAQTVLHALPLQAFGETTGASYGGVIDGMIVTGKPNEVLARDGVEPDVPVVAGTCAQSCTLFVMPNATQRNMSNNTLVARLSALWPPAAVTQILDAYPLSAYQLVPPASAWAHMLSDYVFHCPTRTTASLLAAGSARTHLYVYDHPPHCDHYPRDLHKYMGAYHYADVPATFGSPPLHPPEPCAWSAADAAVSATIQQLWHNFALGKPMATAWPAYDTSSRPLAR